MNWLGLAGSLAGVLGLAAVSWWLGLGRTEPLTAEEVRERAEFELGPFEARDVFVDWDGGSAVVVGADGRLVLFKRHGTQPASRVLRGPFAVQDEGGAIVFPTGDRRFGNVRLRLGEEERDRLKRLL